VVEGGGGSHGGFPSFSPVSSVSLLSPPLFFFFPRHLLFFSSVSSWLSSVVEGGGVSGGQVVCCGGGEEERWQLWFLFFSGIFFISFSVTSRSSPLLCWLSFLSSVSPKNVPPSIILLSSRSLLSLLYSFPCFFFVSTLSVPFSSPLSLWKNPPVSLFRSLFSSPLSLSKNPPVSLFRSPFLLLRSGSIYRGRGSGIDPARSHRCAWGAQSSSKAERGIFPDKLLIYVHQLLKLRVKF